VLRSVGELMDLSGRVALVTGGAGRIGATITDTLAELGASVLVLDHDARGGADLARQIGAGRAGVVRAMAIDLEDKQQIAGVPADVEREFGRLDVVVNCAALVGTNELEGWAVPFDQQSVATWERALDVNLTAAFALTQGCASLLEAGGSGSVINVASIYGLVGPDMRLYDGTSLGNPAAYAVSKGGILQLTRWLATVLAPRVRVNAVTPGGVWRNQPETFVQRYVERTPLRRMASEEDVKGAVAYLASDLSAYVTGHNLVVDGGWTCW
jgi:NAD(P)-dependent dehydrogenase (short-subunit alcohol dehydrogenase family)